MSYQKARQSEGGEAVRGEAGETGKGVLGSLDFRLSLMEATGRG